MNRYVPALGLALGVVLLFGCQKGPRYFEVTGVVSLTDGKPLEDGEILFDPDPPAEHGPDHGWIKEGQFKLKVKEGQHKVRITASAPIPGTKDMYGNPLRKNFVDSRFNDDSTLTADVGEGKTTFTFKVEGPR